MIQLCCHLVNILMGLSFYRKIQIEQFILSSLLKLRKKYEDNQNKLNYKYFFNQNIGINETDILYSIYVKILQTIQTLFVQTSFKYLRQIILSTLINIQIAFLQPHCDVIGFNRIKSMLEDEQIVAKIVHSKDLNSKQKKIKKVVLRRIKHLIKIPKFLCVQNYFQLSEASIINQSSLKDPQNCTQSFLTNAFYFKRIGSLKINQSILELRLNDIVSPKIPINYFIDRYRSFGDREFNNLSHLFQKLIIQFEYITQLSRQKYKKISEENFYEHILSQHLQSIQGKRFVCFFYEPSDKGFCLKKLIFSRKLLELVGLDIQQIKKDYVKYKHIFFEIFGCQIYKRIVFHATSNLAKMLQKSRLGNLSIEQSLKATLIEMKNYIHRRKLVNGCVYEQEVEATIKFYKPQSFITIIQISEIDENKVIRMYPLQKMVPEIVLDQSQNH